MQALNYNMKYFILSLLTFTIISCSTKKNLYPNEILYYGKTTCLGECPVYDFYLFKDGKVVYNGIKNVTKKGRYEFKISNDVLNTLKEEISNINFDNVKSTNFKRDVPKTIIKINGKEIVIQNSKKYINIETLINKIISNN